MPHLGCSGTIIHQNAIVTAAHCCRYLKKSKLIFYQFYVGQFRREDNSMDEYAKLYQPVRYVRHPGFDQYSVQNDICMLFTDEPIEYNQARVENNVSRGKYDFFLILPKNQTF